MPLPLVPDNREVAEILAESVAGPYQFTHHALQPYVSVEPSTEAAITVSAGPRLRLAGQVPSRTVKAEVRFMLLFDVGGIRLLEVSSPDPRVLTRPTWTLREMRLGHPVVEVAPESQPAQPPKPRRTPRLVAREEPPTPSPAPVDATIPADYQALCTREDVQPALGDYVVMPADQVPAHAPPWVIASTHVPRTHVVKPRLGTDTEVDS
jgi:hypothetical protein